MKSFVIFFSIFVIFFTVFIIFFIFSVNCCHFFFIFLFKGEWTAVQVHSIANITKQKLFHLHVILCNISGSLHL